MSKKKLRADFCVIGGGSGGLSFAAGAAQMGASVVLIEGKAMGGDCLNAGCVPSGEIIYPWVILIQNKLKVSALANTIAPYPTVSDINKRIAGQFYTDKLFSPLMRKVVQFIMRFTR